VIALAGGLVAGVRDEVEGLPLAVPLGPPHATNAATRRAGTRIRNALRVNMSGTW
jgi:hypothetical protein